MSLRPYVADPQILSLAIAGDAIASRLLGLSAYSRWRGYVVSGGGHEEAELQRVLADERSKTPDAVTPSILVRRGPTLRQLEAQAREQTDALGDALGVDVCLGIPKHGLIVTTGVIQQEAVDAVQRARRPRPSAKRQAYLSESAVRLLSHSALNVDNLLRDKVPNTAVVRDHLVAVAALLSLPLVTLDEELARGDGIWRIDDSRTGRPAYVVHLDHFVTWVVNAAPFDLLEQVPEDLLSISVAELEKRSAA